MAGKLLCKETVKESKSSRERAHIDLVLNQTDHIDGLMQERRNSIVDALELRLSGTNPSTSCRS